MRVDAPGAPETPPTLIKRYRRYALRLSNLTCRQFHSRPDCKSVSRSSRFKVMRQGLCSHAKNTGASRTRRILAHHACVRSLGTVNGWPMSSNRSEPSDPWNLKVAESGPSGLSACCKYI